MVSVYTGDLDVDLSVIEATLLKKYRVEINFIYHNEDYDASFVYQFVVIDDMVWCVMYKGTKTDPLGILSTSKPIDVFIDYIYQKYTSNKVQYENKKYEQQPFLFQQSHKDITIKDIKIYSYDWYACFTNTKIYTEMINSINKILPEIKTQSQMIKQKNLKKMKENKIRTFENNEQARLMTEMLLSRLQISPPNLINVDTNL